MLRFCSCVFALWLGSAPTHAATVPPKEWKLPPLDGELSGVFSASVPGDSPSVKWKLTVRTEKPLERTVEIQVEGRGMRLKGDARLNPMGEGSWRIAEAEIDLAEWFGWLAPRWVPDLAAATASGTLRVNGEGTWLGGVLGGTASFSLREGRIDDPARQVLLEGISVDVAVADLAARRTEPEQVFTWRSGRYNGIPIGVGRIEALLDGEEIRVNNAAIDVFGGELRVGSLVMSTRKPEFSVTGQMNGVEVGQILFLLPPVLSEARGRLDGSVELSRDASGIQIGDARLTLRQGETADLRLAIKPGWLSTALPPEILKYFPGFRKIETGEIPIRARVLEITMTPLGDEQGRTAWVHLAGGPSDPELTAPIDTTINVRGPLEQLVKIGAELGTNSRLRFSGSK
jgi:hypothetical protein